MQQLQHEILQKLSQVVHAIRTGDIGTAAQLFNDGILSIQTDLSKSPLTADDLKKFRYSLETLIMMQEMENWVAVADILEYELIPLWESFLKKRNDEK